MKIKRICKNCGKEYSVNVKKMNKKFCSMACYNAYRKEMWKRGEGYKFWKDKKFKERQLNYQKVYSEVGKELKQLRQDFPLIFGDYNFAETINFLINHFRRWNSFMERHIKEERERQEGIRIYN